MMFAATGTRNVGAAEGVSAVDSLVLAAVNAPYRRSIGVAALRECIATSGPAGWPVHVATFFTDLPPYLIFDFASAHGISRSRLAEAYAVMKTATGERNPALEVELVPVAASA